VIKESRTNDVDNNDNRIANNGSLFNNDVSNNAMKTTYEDNEAT